MKNESLCCIIPKYIFRLLFTLVKLMETNGEKPTKKFLLLYLELISAFTLASTVEKYVTAR